MNVEGRKATMRSRFLTSSLAAMLLALAQAASAQVYTCMDKQGRRLTADRPIPECNDRPQRILHPNGVVEVLAPKKTEAERLAAEEEIKAQARKRAQEIEAARADRTLRARYPDEAALESHRHYAVSQVERRWQATLDELASLGARRKALTAQVAARRQEGKSPEFAETKEAAEIEKRNNQIRPQVEKARAEIEEVNRQFDASLKRLRELMAIEAEIKRIQAGGATSVTPTYP